MLSLFKVFMSQDVLEPLNNILMSGQLTQGKQVELFETNLKFDLLTVKLQLPFKRFPLRSE